MSLSGVRHGAVLCVEDGGKRWMRHRKGTGSIYACEEGESSPREHV
jgi:hypothetical protein